MTKYKIYELQYTTSLIYSISHYSIPGSMHVDSKILKCDCRNCDSHKSVERYNIIGTDYKT